MPKATFFRLLETPIAEKGERLRQQIAELNAARPAADAFPTDPATFAAIPGSPFAYWASENIFKLYSDLHKFEDDNRTCRAGLCTGDDFRFIRLFWEVKPENIALLERTEKKWINFAKGGGYSPFFSDIYLIVNWGEDGKEIKDGLADGSVPGARPYNVDFYFLPGITFASRPHRKGSFKTLPAGCIYSHNSPAIFAPDEQLLFLAGFTNSSIFNYLVHLQMGRGGTHSSGQTMTYEVGIIQQTPMPINLPISEDETQLSYLAYKLVRQVSLSDETSRVFCLPAILRFLGAGLADCFRTIAQFETERQNALAALQAQIDARVAALYGVPELLDGRQLAIEAGSEADGGAASVETEEESEDESTPLLSSPYSLIADLLMWCVGVAFGRWDVCYALNPESLPLLPEPFDPLPVCSPGMLQGADGLPLNSAPAGYPLPIAMRGFLVDDPERPQDDILTAVRRVLGLLWGANAEAIEQEACQILGVADLRAWFRDPKGFFAWHIKRYSKSRRKAPIYWLIQSARKNYAIWLYYPRLNDDSLFYAAREYADAKLNLENARLEDLQNALNGLSGALLKLQEKKVAAQNALVSEVKTYLKTLDAAALLEIKPNLNDGVMLNLAPLRELAPWKEPTRAWDELLRGKYAWSHIAARLRQKGLVKNA